MATSSQIEQVKVLFCKGFQAKYGESVAVDPADEKLFYKVQPGKNREYPDVFQVRLSKAHGAYRYCSTMKAGVHKRSTKPRYYNVNIASGAVSQACFAQQCMRRADQGRCMVYEGIWVSEDEDESEDEEAEYTFGAPPMKNKKRKCE